MPTELELEADVVAGCCSRVAAASSSIACTAFMISCGVVVADPSCNTGIVFAVCTTDPAAIALDT